MRDVKKFIIDNEIVAIIRGISSEKIVPTVQALTDGGIKCVEVTFNANDKEISKDTLKSIAMIKDTFGDDVSVGAGTVLTTENVKDAAKAGAEYIISPNTSRDVIYETKSLGLVSIPGAVTPTEIIDAYDMGADIIKLFPAASLGLDYIKAIIGPINHIPLTAVGGINALNAKEFIKIGCVGVSVGGNLVNKKLIEENDFESIKKLAQEYKI
jgi:2-dehydro-3-deoxyphosphogluconate aldolase/(4S)-4-hydroxy-2-oxoglutarate aldolase